MRRPAADSFSNVSYALIGGLAQLMVAVAVQTLCSVSGMLTSAPIAISRLTHATEYTSLPKCLLCHRLIYINKLDCALSTHGMTHLVLICCEPAIATMHDYIKRTVEDTGPCVSLPALTCMIEVLIVRVIWLGQMLSEEQNARHNCRRMGIDASLLQLFAMFARFSVLFLLNGHVGVFWVQTCLV